MALDCPRWRTLVVGVMMGRYAWRTLQTYSNTVLFMSCDSLSIVRMMS